MFNNDHIDILIAREIEGAITASERAELDAWLQADARNRTYYEAMHDTWDLTAEADDAPEPDVAMNWQRFQQRMDEQPAVVETPVIPMRRNWFRIAAAAMVIVAAAGIAFIFFANNTVTITAQADKKEVHLPDGSTVVLNRNSQISYRKGFSSSHRELALQGEAFFDVKPDATHPFMVTAGKSQTQVLGTSFVIKAYEHKTIQLNVVTGKVAFSGKQSDKDALVLTAGNMAIMQENKEPQRIQNVDPNFMAWKEEHLEFNNVPLNRTLNVLEEYFNVKFMVDDPSLLTLGYTGKYDHPTLEEVLKVLGESYHVTIREESKGVYRVTQQ